jgi:hypothetical protein
LAFSNTPQNSTYRTVQVKFDDTSTLRSADNTVRRDSHIINFYYDRISQENQQREVCLVKRPGLSATTATLNKVTSTDSIRGYFYDEQDDIYFWAVGNKVYAYISGTATLNTLITLSTSSGVVCFQSFRASTNLVYVAFSDGTTLAYYQLRVGATTATAVVDPDLPVPHNPRFAVLDGYVFISSGNTIYNSDVDSITSWTAGNDLDAEMSGDVIVALIQNKNYIVALGLNSLEIFWDAANASGSPLKRNDSGFKSIGYLTGYAQSDDKHFFVGQDRNANVCVYMMENFKVDRISNAVVERTIQSINTTGFSTGRVLPDSNGVILSVDGHTFYCFTTTDITWVYDVEEKMWYEWRSAAGDTFRPEAAWSKFGGGQYIANYGSNTIDILSSLVYNDKGVNFTCSYTTQDSLFGSVNWKTCNRVSLVADRHLPSGTSNAVLQWSDNDWADGVTGQQNVNLFSNLPRTFRAGRFRNRSFRVLYTDNYPVRMKYLELEINIGSH